MASRGSYPHPVLDASNDVNSTFEAINATVSPSHDDVEIAVELRTDDDDLICLLYTSPSPRDATLSRMPSSA